MNLFKASLISAIVATTFNVNAETVDLDDVTIEVATEEVKRGHRLGFPGRTAILDYMLENGDITQDEIDAKQLERETFRAEVQALKEAGDTEGADALKATHREEKQADSEARQAYVAENEELQVILDEIKEDSKGRNKGKGKGNRKGGEE